jgi:tripartite-type tricarboxylate transporter receptor subunit TctC
MFRREGQLLIKISGLLIVCEVLAASAHAQTFPQRTVRFIVPFAAGGTIDIVGRLVAPSMSKALGQQIVVENRPGGGTVIATELVARAQADTHTLLLMGPSYTINLFARKLPYDTERDFAGIARLVANPLLLSIHPSLPARNIKELVALARAKPGELTYATASPTGFQRLAVERFRGRTVCGGRTAARHRGDFTRAQRRHETSAHAARIRLPRIRGHQLVWRCHPCRRAGRCNRTAFQ